MSDKNPKTGRAIPEPESAPLFKEHKVGAKPPAKPAPPSLDKAGLKKTRTGESGGPDGLEPTRYGDWERKGICVDF